MNERTNKQPSKQTNKQISNLPWVPHYAEALYVPEISVGQIFMNLFHLVQPEDKEVTFGTLSLPHVN